MAKKNNARRLKGGGHMRSLGSGNRLADFLDLAGTDAARASMNTNASAMGAYSLDALHIRLGDLLAFVVSVAHFVAAEPAFTANFAFTCHESNPPLSENDCLKDG
jgi:hypothetical protein